VKEEVEAETVYRSYSGPGLPFSDGAIGLQIQVDRKAFTYLVEEHLGTPVWLND
jgi:hypothetical protein